ncbi:MAG: hypothetical protein JWM80_5974 [Cyanobacteria bacterium RYN_339]|nr:hypothetical protein [Cyanobacteria bacterium RYN_339]
MEPMESTGITAKTLREALKFFIEDDGHVDRLEAEALRGLIYQDGRVTPEEKAFLQEAVTGNNFDDRALAILETVIKNA